MNQICKDIQSYGLVPVIKIEDVSKAVPLAKALCDGAQSLTPDMFDETMAVVRKVRAAVTE